MDGRGRAQKLASISHLVHNQAIVNGENELHRRPRVSTPNQRPESSLVRQIPEQMTLEESAVAFKDSFIKRHFSDFRSSSRSVFVVFCVLYAFYQVVVTTITYFEYNTGVAVKMEDIVSLERSLPGITVCNKNLIEKSAAFEFMPGFDDAIKLVLSEQDLDTATRNKHLIEVYEDFMSTYYASMSVSRQLNDGPKIEDFLKYLDCNRKGWPEYDEASSDMQPSKFKCQEREWINTAQGKGNCITLFHQGSKMKRKERPVNPSLESVRDEIMNFVPNEAVKLVLDFAPDNYTDLRIEPGGEIMIHDPRIVPLEAALSYTLRPGKFYQFYVSQITTRSLQAPYASNCTDYYRNYWSQYQNRSVFDSLMYPLSETQCEENCLIENFVNKSKCWPKAVPFWEARLVTGNQQYNVTWCHRVNATMEARKQFFSDFERFRTYCNQKCGPDCLRNYYRTFLQAVDWPANERIWSEADPAKRESLKQLRSCCALVSISYSRSSISINQIYPKMEVISFLSEIGGVISMWIGVCIVNVHDLLVLILDFVHTRFIARYP